MVATGYLRVDTDSNKLCRAPPGSNRKKYYIWVDDVIDVGFELVRVKNINEAVDDDMFDTFV